ncbi:hypothetical protein K402DRAFT_378004 [Aulographum hederae CBS 113979]|uniref:Calcineurin-like phosphoesterase domain-containing protein n=1 Tax=Aulographum hederae CBS 113979 TaxID=1176131 RepID=A0A6G1GZ87_9PEZI|nr:hypothetical protein K402DRAFT_378004 [Aulographum hederae CBS 113979]
MSRRMSHMYKPSSRNQFREPPTFASQSLRFVKIYSLRSWTRLKHYAYTTDFKTLANTWNVRRVFTVANVLTALWILVLYWGERSSFKSSFKSCEWSNWETWPSDAIPHHLVFLADPQLIDPHTYPGRPWPLSTLTIKHTDLYLRRGFQHVQKRLYPDTIFFLGDLFDGGREWSTLSSKSPEEQWHKYGMAYWLKEYDRFGRIFFKNWIKSGSTPRLGQQGRKLITSLPGNHDLGFGSGIQIPVRKRFNAYFGDGNRIDVIANHTFISLDTVSLSAMDQQGIIQEDLWKPTEDFLGNIQANRERAVTREVRRQAGKPVNQRYKHRILEEEDLKEALSQAGEEPSDMPTILLTHVPLYRAPGTPCGPLREHWPPTPPSSKGQTEPLEHDDRNAIRVAAGHQYQNVLTDAITKDITSKIGDISWAFSGDDHDYCELVHKSYPSAGSGIREITVKSMSWAMGVRKPGFLMLSMWNPLDEKRAPSTSAEKSDTSRQTIQTHLCLLPNQLSIFIRYATLAVLTILVLLARAAHLTLHPEQSALANEATAEPLLPTFADNKKVDSSSFFSGAAAQDMKSSSSASHGASQHLSARSSNARTRSVSPSAGYGLKTQYTTPLVQHAGYRGPAKDDDGEDAKGVSTAFRSGKPKRRRGFRLFAAEARRALIKVAVVAFGFWFWLVWKG